MVEKAPIRGDISMLPKYRMSIDGIGCQKDHCLEAISDFLLTLTSTLKVRPRASQIYEVTDLVPNAMPGVSASVIFLESSLVLHTYPGKKEAALDLNVCKEIDFKTVERAFKLFFQPKVIDVKISYVVEVVR